MRIPDFLATSTRLNRIAFVESEVLGAVPLSLEKSVPRFYSEVLFLLREGLLISS